MPGQDPEKDKTVSCVLQSQLVHEPWITSTCKQYMRVARRRDGSRNRYFGNSKLGGRRFTHEFVRICHFDAMNQILHVKQYKTYPRVVESSGKTSCTGSPLWRFSVDMSWVMYNRSGKQNTNLSVEMKSSSLLLVAQMQTMPLHPIFLFLYPYLTRNPRILDKSSVCYDPPSRNFRFRRC